MKRILISFLLVGVVTSSAFALLLMSCDQGTTTFCNIVMTLCGVRACPLTGDAFAFLHFHLDVFQSLSLAIIAFSILAAALFRPGFFRLAELPLGGRFFALARTDEADFRETKKIRWLRLLEKRDPEI